MPTRPGTSCEPYPRGTGNNRTNRIGEITPIRFLLPAQQKKPTDKQKFSEQFAVLKASLVKGRWVALKRRLGGILHIATPLFRKVFGEFVLPARIPPDRLKGDPTPFNKGVFGAGKLFDKHPFDFISIPWAEPIPPPFTIHHSPFTSHHSPPTIHLSVAPR